MLDLGLPTLRGESVLEELAANPRTQNISVIVGTGKAEIPQLRAWVVLRTPTRACIALTRSPIAPAKTTPKC